MNTKFHIIFGSLVFSHVIHSCPPPAKPAQPPMVIIPTTTTPSCQQREPSSSCKCGVTKARQNAIVGGQATSKNEYPWMVALVKKGSSKPFCEGSLISSRTVLTSARCAQQINSNVIVHIGEHDVKQDDGE